MIWAVLSTFCCCLPLGIVSIYYAAKVDSFYNAGDYEGAQKAADNAKKFAIWAAVTGIIVRPIIFILNLYLGFLSVLAGN